MINIDDLTIQEKLDFLYCKFNELVGKYSMMHSRYIGYNSYSENMLEEISKLYRYIFYLEYPCHITTTFYDQIETYIINNKLNTPETGCINCK